VRPEDSKQFGIMEFPMFGWLRPKAVCPIDQSYRDWIDSRWKWLENEFGLDRLRNAPVVLPRPQYFPDRYCGTEEDAKRMLGRVCTYMGIDANTIDLIIYQDNTPSYEGHWRQATAGLYQAHQGKFRIWIEVSNLDDPLAMVATMSHELGHVHLLGHGRLSEDAEDQEPLTDLLTVFFGLGVITANSVIREHYWHEGNSSGWRMGRRGYLGMPQYGYALSLFARARGEDGSRFVKELRLDVRSAFRQSMRFLAAEAATDRRTE
jgi:hypothetical protein